MSRHDLARLEAGDADGVFAARQLGRSVAAELQFEHSDQVRIAIAISEVTRAAVSAGDVVQLRFAVTDADLVVTLTTAREMPAGGVAAAAKLMDEVAADGTGLRLIKRRPGGRPVNASVVRGNLAAQFPASAARELRRQNQDLMAALGDVRQQKEQLLAKNAELAEMNNSVMALYGQLSAELEQTNRGVVALYAELDEASKQLRAASESKNRFWANVSHELRSPLNSIIGLAGLLADPAGGQLNREQAYQVELITGAGTALLAMVNDLLDVAKAESGRLVLEPAQVTLLPLLHRVAALVRPMAAAGAVEVVVRAEDAPGTILTDEVALTGILRNLLSNGVKYTDHGEVALSARAVGPALEISVADTGLGIPAASQEKVFEEFYQVPGARRGGTGLGLPYARRLARLLGGELTLASEPGAGTTVTLTLPHDTAQLGTVVVADDDPAFRELLRTMLTGLATRVIEAADGRDALAALAAGPADLLLTDLAMPGLPGAGLLAELAGSVPAIVVSGLDTGARQEPLPPPGAAAMLRKDEISRDRLEFEIRRAVREPR